MFILSNVISGLAMILDVFLQFYMFIMLGRVIISWVDAPPTNPIVQFLHRATEPVLKRFRRWTPWMRAGMLDLTPLAVFALIYFLQMALVRSLLDIANSLKG